MFKFQLQSPVLRNQFNVNAASIIPFMFVLKVPILVSICATRFMFSKTIFPYSAFVYFQKQY